MTLLLLTLAMADEPSDDLQTEEESLYWCRDKQEWYSCSQLGTRYLAGELPHDDPVSIGVELVTLACDNDYANGCYNLAAAYLNAMVDGKDLTDALPLYEKACALGDGESCAVAAGWHLEGDKKTGVPENPDRSLELAVAGCKTNSEFACYVAGFQYLKGLGTEPDYAKAKQFAGRACQRGRKPACKIAKKAAKKAE